MKKPWSKPVIKRLDITNNHLRISTMKRLILAALFSIMFIAPAVVFYVANGRVKMNNITITQGIGSLTVRPTGVVIKP
jgi:hypothetical protein